MTALPLRGGERKVGMFKGSIIRYDKNSNDWVRAYGTGPTTLFKPNDAEKYFKKIKKYET